MSKNEHATPPEQAAETYDLMESLNLLDPHDLEVEQTVGEGLTLRSPALGKKKGLSVEPCFPVTQPGRFLVFRDGDGDEVGILMDINDLSHGCRDVVATELAKQHFIPIITRVDAIHREFQIPQWEVQTDRGPRRIELRSRHDAQRLGGGRIYLRDADGNGYLIPDVKALDPQSQRHIEINV